MGFFDFLKKPRSGAATDFSPAADLGELLAQAAHNPAYQPEFYRRLLLDDLVVVSEEVPAAPQHATLAAGASVRLHTLPDGRVPVFTSTARIFDGGVVQEQVGFLQMKGRALLEMVQRSGVVLNPNSATSKALTPAEIQSLLDGTVLQTGHSLTVTEDTQVLIGQPAVYPQAMVDALTTLLGQQPRVVAAYLAWLHVPTSGEPPHYVLGLEVEGSMQAISREAGFVAQQFLSEQEVIDIMQVAEGSGLTSYFRSTKPFYERE